MLRWIAALTAALTLTGCVTERVVYRDRYVDDRYADSRVYRDDSYAGQDRYAGSGTYYSPSYSGRGDYYYRGSDYYGYDDSPSWYWDYPAYYSVFWPMYRSWHDPYWYPNYYYGVTYYPRNYFSISFNSGWGWPRYSSFYYSPYRYAWVDNYYDWTPWHGHHSHRNNRYQAPRYGSARNEAERLSRHSDWNQRGYGAGGYNAERGVSSYGARDTAFGRYGTTRGGTRDADYGNQPAPRQMPTDRGFGVNQGSNYGRNAEVRRNAAYGDQNSANRQAPATRGFGVPVPQSGRDARYDAQAPRAESYPRYSAPAPRGYQGERPGATREAARYGSAPVRGADRGYDTGVNLPRRSESTGYEARRYESSAPREYSRPAMPSRGYEISPPPQRVYREAPRQTYEPQRGYSPQTEARNYSPPSRGYDAGDSAPAPRFESRAEPRYESRPEPRFESRPEPSYESRSESRESRSESSDSDVRRVGSNRDED